MKQPIIETRAWNIEDKRMEYLSGVWNDCCYFDGDGDYVEDWPVMLSTGLLDITGKKIFQGDYVEYDGRRFEIVWCNGGFKMMETKSFIGGAIDGWLNEIFTQCMCGKVTDLKIVGHIYEN